VYIPYLMKDNAPFDLNSEKLDSIPIINHFITKLRLEDMLKRYISYNNKRHNVTPDLSIGVLLRNIILEREPAYGLKEWASGFAPVLFSIQPDHVKLLNDDRIGRALEKLFDADRASLMTEVVVNTIHEFDLKLNQLHNDSTTVTFYGIYENANGGRKRGKRTLKITRGHNKDHRPDLKQLLWTLTVTADGAVPIHYRVSDGNTTDDTVHIDTWKTLRELVGHSNFLYVADSKLCVSDTLRFIDGEKGKFITVMPRTRSEDEWFRNYIIDHNITMEEINIEPGPYKKDESDEIWRAVESPISSSEGFRIVWFWSSQKAEQDMDKRQGIMEKAILQLDQLQGRLNSKKCRFHTKESVAEIVDDIIKKTEAQRWITYEIKEKVETVYRQTKRGRPGSNTQYEAHNKTRFFVIWHPITNRINADAHSDGMFPLITNCHELSHKDILEKYKYQPMLEKRHEQLKSVNKIAPVLLKSITRIEGLLFVHFLALLIQALIEREVRLGMDKAGLKSIPIYYEDRECIAPTAPRILGIFNNLQRHYLVKNDKIVQTFNPKYTRLQRQILDLINIPRNIYPGMTK